MLSQSLKFFAALLLAVAVTHPVSAQLYPNPQMGGVTVTGTSNLSGPVNSAALQPALGITPVKSYGAVGDGVLNGNCTVSLSTPKLLSCLNVFPSSAQGTSIWIRGAGSSGSVLATTISVATGTTTVTLAAPAQTALSGLSWQEALYGTDDTSAVQAAIASLSAGQTLSIPKGRYIISGTLVLDNKVSIALIGNGNARVALDYQNSPQLVYVPTTGSLISAKSAIGLEIGGLGLNYFSDGYTGRLIDFEQGTGGLTSEVQVHDNAIGGLAGVLKGNTQAGNADALVYMNLVYDISFVRNVWTNAQVAIKGPTASISNANSIFIGDKNLFSGGFHYAPIAVMGQMWTISGNTFEPLDNNVSGGRTCGGITINTPAGGANTAAVDGLLIQGNTFEDAIYVGNCIDLEQIGDVSGVEIAGNEFIGGGTAVRFATIGHTRGLHIAGNHMQSMQLGVFSYSTGSNVPYHMQIIGNNGLYTPDSTVSFGSYTDPIILSNITAPITATGIHTGGLMLPSGLYRINYYIRSAAYVTGGTSVLSFSWQDPSYVTATVAATTLDLTTYPFTDGSVLAMSSGNVDVKYSLAITGTGTPSINLYIAVERLF